MKILERSFYERDTKLVAQELLGKLLVRETSQGKMTGRIVETEAYFGPGDIASHAHRGPTPRSSVMFGPPGHAYVYFTYGMHYLFNIVTEEEGKAGAVLIRALEPLEGIDLMIKRRPKATFRNLTNGPAKLTQALDITLDLNRRDITQGRLVVIDDGFVGFDIVKSPRIGVPLDPFDNFRYYIKGNKYVSKK